MTPWPSTKARQSLAALQRIGWQIERSSGSHRTLTRPGWSDFMCSLHENEEIGPNMPARIARRTGLQQSDL